jgi:hypothetical protein
MLTEHRCNSADSVTSVPSLRFHAHTGALFAHGSIVSRSALLPARLLFRSMLLPPQWQSFGIRENRARLSRFISLFFLLPPVQSDANFECMATHTPPCVSDHSIPLVPCGSAASFTDLATDRNACLRMTSATCSNTLSTWCWSIVLIHRINHHVVEVLYLGPIGCRQSLLVQ